MRVSLPSLLFLILGISAGAGAQSFSRFELSLAVEPDSIRKIALIERYFYSREVPLIEDSSVVFIYQGRGTHVAVPGDLNGWNPAAAPMRRLAGTNLFVRVETLPLDARAEYKLWVDSTWMLDMRNTRRAMGGFGENSELRMPGWKTSLLGIEGSGTLSYHSVPLETLWVSSSALGRRYPVYMYLPLPESRHRPLPLIFVTDGGDYITLGRLEDFLNRLIAQKLIRPVAAAFIDPRTDPHDPASNKRMIDYSANDAFLDFLEKELTPLIESRYPVSGRAEDRLILGASMGGLISSYAVLKRPRFILNSASQSPAYWQADSAVVKLVWSMNRCPGEFYIQTGTIHDTRQEASLVADLLRERGARVTYEEYHEGHNWTNWRVRLDPILVHFFPYR